MKSFHGSFQMNGRISGGIALFALLFTLGPVALLAMRQELEVPVVAQIVCLVALLGSTIVFVYCLYAYLKRVTWQFAADDEKIVWSCSDHAGPLREIALGDLRAIAFYPGSSETMRGLYFDLKSGERVKVPERCFCVEEFLSFAATSYPQVPQRIGG